MRRIKISAAKDIREQEFSKLVKTGCEHELKRVHLRGSRIALLVFGVLLSLAGATFALQGMGDLGTGSFMDSNPTWIYAGSFLLIVGLVLATFSFYLKPRT